MRAVPPTAPSTPAYCTDYRPPKTVAARGQANSPLRSCPLPDYPPVRPAQPACPVSARQGRQYTTILPYKGTAKKKKKLRPGIYVVPKIMLFSPQSVAPPQTPKGRRIEGVNRCNTHHTVFGQSHAQSKGFILPHLLRMSVSYSTARAWGNKQHFRLIGGVSHEQLLT